MRARVLWLAVLATLIAAACVFLLPISYAYVPSRTAGLNPWRTHTPPTYDIWGEEVDAASAKALLATTEGRARLSPARGAVRIDDDVIERGYDAFHAETFGNELVLSDIVGILDGPLTPVSFLRALVALGGRGTTNLRVPMAYAVTVGGRRFEQGQLIDTGLDVPRGAYAILGMKMRAERGRVRAGITCAACHSTVDSQTLRVIHGAPNWDLNTGALLAFATNSAAFFMHTDVDPRAVRQD